jgi:hypothetical protein
MLANREIGVLGELASLLTAQADLLLSSFTGPRFQGIITGSPLFAVLPFIFLDGLVGR